MGSGYDSAKTTDKIREGEIDANLDAVTADDHALSNMMLAAERAGIDDESSPFYQLLSRGAKSHTMRNAVQSGHVPTFNALTGLSETRYDATGYDLLVNALKPAAQQILVKGAKGTGKSTKAIDLGKRLYHEFDAELSIATNIRQNDEEEIEHPAVDYVDSISEMLAWVRDTDGEKLVIGDEWSSLVNAHANSGNIGALFSQFINALRKGKGGSTRLLIIGHEHDTDIAAILRNQSDVVIRADGKKDDGLIDCATVFDGWDDYKTDDEWFQVRGMQDVPEASQWGFSTNYFATFELDLDNPSKQIKDGKLREDWEDYQDSDGADDPDAGEDADLCIAEKKAGGRCPQDAKFPEENPLFCHGHRDELAELTSDDGSGDPDPRIDGDGDSRAAAEDAVSGLQDLASAVDAVTDDNTSGDERDIELLANTLTDRFELEADEALAKARELTGDGDSVNDGDQ